MAGASGKKISSQNAKTVQQGRIGFAVSGAIYVLSVVLFSSMRKKKNYIYFALSEAIALYLWSQLESMARSGTAIATQEGLAAYFFDIIYVTWFVHVATALISSYFWLVYLIIPIFAIYKLVAFAKPFLFPGTGQQQAAGANGPVPTSKRQEKLKKRMEKGDGRVQRKFA